MKLRVLHAAKYYPPVTGGMETVVGHLCTGLAGEWDVTVIAAHDRAGTVRERRDGVSVVRASAWGRAASVALCPTQPFHLWRGRYDCVVLHEPNPVAAAALLVRVPAARLIIWHHSDLVRPAWARTVYPALQRSLYRRAACVIASSPRLAELSPAVRYAGRVAVIPFGVSPDDFDSGATARVVQAAAAIRRQHPTPRVLFIGRLVYYKGLDVLLRAMEDCPGSLLIAGEGPLETSLRQLARRLGLTGRVHFFGGVSTEQLHAFYAASDLLVLPSTEPTEAFGVVQIEAMARGLPVVSTGLPTGVPWVNQDGVTGLVVPPGDSRALAAAMRRLLDEPALSAAMGAAGRRRAAEEFGLENMVQRFRVLVEDVVGR